MLNEMKSRFSGKIKFLFIALLLVIAGFTPVKAQGLGQSNQFTFGAYLSGRTNQAVETAFDTSGFRTAWWSSGNTLKDTFLLKQPSVILWNGSSTDWIHLYSSGYYSKWLSKDNQTQNGVVGVKHAGGNDTTWKGIKCWSSIGTSGPTPNLVYGPDYFQEKKYRDMNWNNFPPQYIVRFKMAFAHGIPPNYQMTDTVCQIKVYYRYRKYVGSRYITLDTTFKEKTLTVGDFPGDSSFKYFYFDGAPYQYPSYLPANPLGSDPRINTNEPDPWYTDWLTNTGVQFIVDWLGNNSLGTLYVYDAEVYDADIWQQYIDPSTRPTVINNIHTYLTDFSNQGWTNIKYWNARDEPSTIDAFVPYHTVESLLDSLGSVPLIVQFYNVGVIKNGDSLLKYYMKIAKPKIRMFDNYTFR